MQILDIGSGKWPWIIRQHHNDHRPPHPILNGIDFLSEDVVYCCIDNDTDHLAAGGETYLEMASERYMNEPRFRLMDARNLDFDDETADRVIISDVFSIPERNWCTCADECDFGYDQATALREGIPPCTGEVCKALRFEEKKQVLNEVLRVLKPLGILIIALYQTPIEAYRMLAHLKGESQLEKIEELCRGDNNGENGDIYWAEKVFRKK